MPGDHKQKKKVKDLREKLAKVRQGITVDGKKYKGFKEFKEEQDIINWEGMSDQEQADADIIYRQLTDDSPPAAKKDAFTKPNRPKTKKGKKTNKLSKKIRKESMVQDVDEYYKEKKGKIRKADATDINRVTRWDERTFNKRREMPKKKEENVEIDRSDVELHPYQAIAKLRKRLAKVENYKAESDPEASPGEWLSEYKKKRKSKVRKADGGIAPNYLPTKSHDPNEKKKKKQKTAAEGYVNKAPHAHTKHGNPIGVGEEPSGFDYPERIDAYGGSSYDADWNEKEYQKDLNDPEWRGRANKKIFGRKKKKQKTAYQKERKKKGSRLTSTVSSGPIKTPKNKQYLERRKKKDYVKNAKDQIKGKSTGQPMPDNREFQRKRLKRLMGDITSGNMTPTPEQIQKKKIRDKKEADTAKKLYERRHRGKPKKAKVRHATELIDPRVKKKKTVRPDSNVQKVSQRIAEMKVDKDHNHKIQFRVHEGSQYRRASLAKQEGKYAKYWLLNAKQTNGNGWGVSQTSIAKNINKFIGRPFVITAKQWVAESEYGDQFEHPYLPTNNISQIINHQEKFRVGSIVDVIEKDGDYHAVIEMNSKFANMMLPPFCSPAIFQNNPGEADGQISDWEALHLAGLMEDPAYGARIALLKGSCVGTADACSVQFKSAKQAKMVCPKKMKNLKGRLAKVKLAYEPPEQIEPYNPLEDDFKEHIEGEISSPEQRRKYRKVISTEEEALRKKKVAKPRRMVLRDDRYFEDFAKPKLDEIHHSEMEKWAKLKGRLAGVIKPKKADSVDGTIDKLVKEVKDPANKEDLVKRLGTTPNEHGPKNYGATKAKDFSSRRKVSKKKQKIAVKKPAWDKGFDRHCVTCDNALTDAEVKYEMRGGCSKGPGRCTSHRLRTKKSKVRQAIMPPEDPVNLLERKKRGIEGNYRFPTKQLLDESKAIKARSPQKKVKKPIATQHPIWDEPPGTDYTKKFNVPKGRLVAPSAAYTSLRELEKGAKISKLRQRLVRTAKPIIQETGEGITFKKVDPKIYGKKTYGFHKVPMHPSNAVLIRPKDPKKYKDMINHFRKIHETNDFAKYTQGSVQQSIPLHSLKNDIKHMSGDKLKFHADISSAKGKAFKKGDILMRRVGGTPEKGKYGTVGETFYIEEDSPVGEIFNAPSKYKRHGKLRSATIKPLTKKKKKGKAIRKVSSKSK